MISTTNTQTLSQQQQQQYQQQRHGIPGVTNNTIDSNYQFGSIMMAPSNLSFGTLDNSYYVPSSPSHQSLNQQQQQFYSNHPQQSQQQSLFFDHQQLLDYQNSLFIMNNFTTDYHHQQQGNVDYNNSRLTTISDHLSRTSSSSSSSPNILLSDTSNNNNYHQQQVHSISDNNNNSHFIPIIDSEEEISKLTTNTLDSSSSPSLLLNNNNTTRNINNASMNNLGSLRYSSTLSFPSSPSSSGGSGSGNNRSSMIDSLGPPQKTKPNSKCASETILEILGNVHLNQQQFNDSNLTTLKIKLRVVNSTSDCKQWPIVSQTNMIKSSGIFKMEEPLIYHYKFHHLQKICISLSSDSDETIGECFLLSNDLITTLPLLKKPIHHSDESFKRINSVVGTINMIIEESSIYNNLVSLQFSARNLDGKGYIQDTSDPYLVVSRQDVVEGFYEQVIVTEYKHTKNPTWKQKKIATFELTNTNFDTPLKIEVFDWNIDKRKHSYIGVFETTFNELKISQGREFSLINERFSQNPNYSSSGIVKLDLFSIESRPNICQYLKNGYSLDLIVNIDVNFERNDMDLFSARYSQAIHMFGSAMENFNKKEHKLFYHRGKPRALMEKNMSSSRATTTAQSCFEAVNVGMLNSANLRVQHLISKQMEVMNGLNGGEIVPSGQVNLLAPIIYNARNIAKKQSVSEKCYCTVLVLTHTDINDINSTIKELQQCSGIPMSIIVVGISENDNFANLVELDSRFRNYFEMNGNQTVRDLFTFCTFSNISSGIKSIADHFIQYVEQEGEYLLDCTKPSVSILSPKLSFQEVPQQKRSYDIKF